MKKYSVQEIFYSLQGEGVNTGEPMVFVRFAGCNLKCSKYRGYRYNCDTFFNRGVSMAEDEIVATCKQMIQSEIPGEGYNFWPRWVVFTGGEPGLQLTLELVQRFRDKGMKAAIESNGTQNLEGLCLDFICISPKVPLRELKQNKADEVRFVVADGDEVPSREEVWRHIETEHLLISPANEYIAFVPDLERQIGGPSDGEFVIPLENLRWAIKLCKVNPDYRLSIQQHHGWGVR